MIYHGDCLEVLRTLPDCSVDAVVTDPPYGLSFMGKKWDYDVPSVEVWAECLRVLKPGGHLLAFAGTRTQHRMAVRIEDAGFEIRDMIAWVYGCLSEDSEVLTEDGWMPYNKAKQKSILAYDLQNDVYQWEKPSRWNEYRVKSDTAYRIQSNHTDQIVSRGHRCIVERGGVLAFVPADELSGMERVPYLRGDFSALPQGCGELLLQAVLRESEELAQASFSQWQGQEAAREGAFRGEKPGVEGWRDILQTQGQVCGSVDQVRALPGEHDEHGTQGRVCDGTSACGSNGDRQAAGAVGVCAPHQPRCNGQQAGEPNAVCDQCGSQAVRTRPTYQTTLATVTAVRYTGLIFCPTVSTGAFVARRNGKVFITGNSGFPKSMDVSKAIDKAAGAEREVTGSKMGDVGIQGGNFAGKTKWSVIELRDAPATPEAQQWAGWGTALKPALEPITMARKPLIGTVAANVLAHGTGAINVDACRIMQEGQERDADAYRRLSSLGSASYIRGLSLSQIRGSLLHIASVLRSYSTGDTGRLRSADDLDGTLLDLALCERLVARLFPNGAWCGGSSWSVPDSLCGCQSCRHSCDEHTRLLREVSQGGAPSLADALERICSGRFGLGHNRECRCNGRLSSSDDSQLAWSFSFLVGEYCTLYSATPQGARWPANLIHDGSDEVVAGFPVANDESAARFFYAPKASKRDRDEGLEGFALGNNMRVNGPRESEEAKHATLRANTHPTVKPTDLMRYLCRLVTPPGGTVLDPFMGSGSTGKAAMFEGFSFIGIEREAEYVEIAKARIAAVQAKPKQEDLF